MYLNLDSEVTERETYSLLEWLGDIGGLLDALRHIGTFVVAPITSFSLSSDLLSSIFTRQKHVASAPETSNRLGSKSDAREINDHQTMLHGSQCKYVKYKSRSCIWYLLS